MADKIIYLASPYSHPDAEVREARFKRVVEIAQRLTIAGYIVFSPIVHSHPLATNEQIATDWEFWKRIDTAFINVCAEVWVARMDGWMKSKGVAAEIALADKLGKPVKYISG